MLRKRTRWAVLVCLLVRTEVCFPAQAQSEAGDSGPPTKTVLFPLDEVRPGLHGTAYTVFSGVRPEAMSVEILGRLTNALGPKRDLILARLHGSKPEYTGVVAGMSGSPVYIDGKLVGALSYRIGQFSKEPIAGITPIEQMLEVSGDQPASVVAGTNTSGGAEMRPIESPLVFGGFSQETVDRFGGSFRAMGLLPVSGLGGMNAETAQTETLQPGSAVSAVLVQGDLSVTATCTVSYVDATKLLACGHPLTQAGEIDLPMAKAVVLATLPSPLNSFKIVNTTEIAGAFRQDRSSAIYGLVGAHARMIPVTIKLASESGTGAAKTLHFEVANHRELTPQLIMAAIYQCLQQVLSGSAETSYRTQGVIRTAVRSGGAQLPTSLPDVTIDGWQSQSGFNPGAVNAALWIGDRFVQLFADAEEQPEITAVDLGITTSDRRRSATLETARASPQEVRPGGVLEVESVVQPYQRPAQRLHTTVTLPNTLEPGGVRLLVSDGASLDRLLEPTVSHPLSMPDTVGRLNGMHADNRVYVTLLTHAPQAVLDAAPLTEIPLSMANVLEPLKGAQRLRLSGESVVELGSTEADDAISGSQVLTLTVR